MRQALSTVAGPSAPSNNGIAQAWPGHDVDNSEETHGRGLQVSAVDRPTKTSTKSLRNPSRLIGPTWAGFARAISSSLGDRVVARLFLQPRQVLVDVDGRHRAQE